VISAAVRGCLLRPARTTRARETGWLFLFFVLTVVGPVLRAATAGPDTAWTGGWVLVPAYLATLTRLVVAVARARDRTRQNRRRSFDSVPRNAS
jgi:hypothetical protein